MVSYFTLSHTRQKIPQKVSSRRESLNDNKAFQIFLVILIMTFSGFLPTVQCKLELLSKIHGL